MKLGLYFHYAENVTSIAYLQNFISQLKLLQGMSEGTLQHILNIAKVEKYFEGDRISGAKIEENLIFVMAGKLIRSMEKKDGWYNTLDMIAENGWINETVLLENRKTKMSAEIWTDTATLMLIPIEEIKKLFGQFEYKILQHLLIQMEKYQRLWIKY